MLAEDWHSSQERRAELYLNDKQYFILLENIKKTINTHDFKVYCYDSTEIGNKYTASNCGLCNDEYCTFEMALFPRSFPDRKTIKYRENWHKCPFDMRPISNNLKNGCFYTCYLFKTHNGKHDIELMKLMVENTIKEVKKWLDS